MIIKERMRFGITLFGRDWGFFYDAHYFVPLTKLSKINDEQKQVGIGNDIKKGIAENTEKHNREMRLTA